jgi:hypothetical protein
MHFASSCEAEFAIGSVIIRRPLSAGRELRACAVRPTIIGTRRQERADQPRRSSERPPLQCALNRHEVLVTTAKRAIARDLPLERRRNSTVTPRSS